VCCVPCAAFFAKLIDKYFQEGEVTGLLLCYPNCAVHLLEVGSRGTNIWKQTIELVL
jgi:hypothetical protein